jgi:hypothetical protein
VTDAIPDQGHGYNTDFLTGDTIINEFRCGVMTVLEATSEIFLYAAKKFG